VIRASRVLALCGLLTAALPVPAAAEWQFAPFVGTTFAGGTNLFDPEDGATQRHWNFGGTERLLGPGILGLESVFVYIPAFFQRDNLSPLFPDSQPSSGITSSRSMALMGNIVLTTPRTWNQYGLRPFVSGGFGLLHAFHDDASLPLRGNLLGYNVGGGAVGLLTDRVGVRFDLRYFRVPPGQEPTGTTPTVGDRVSLHYWTATVGVVFKR
jgi:hypothetical protein